MTLAGSGWRFAAVGVSATFLHVLTASTLIIKGQMHPVGANAIAFIVANLVSYLANALWSFRARPQTGNFLRFGIVSLAAWFLTMAIAWAAGQAGAHYLAGIALVVLVVPPVTYLAHRSFTFGPPVR